MKMRMVNSGFKGLYAVLAAQGLMHNMSSVKLLIFILLNPLIFILLNPLSAEVINENLEDQRDFFLFEIIITVLVSSF